MQMRNRRLRGFQGLLAVSALALPLGAGECDWIPRFPSPIERLEAGSAVVDGRLFLFGGFTGHTLLASRETDVYDPATDTWTRLSDMPTAVTHIGFAVDGSDVWIVGGFQGNHPGTATPAVWVYDTATDSWSAGPPLPAARAGGAAVRLGRDLHYFGGTLPDRDTNSANHWVLDLDSPGAGWTSAAPLPVPRTHLSGCAVGGRALAIGGADGHDVSPIDLTSVHVFDPATGAWSELAPMPFPRSHHESATFLLGGQVIVAGGRLNAVPALADVSAYDPAFDRWTTLTSLPGPLLGPSVKAIGTSLYCVGGGTVASQPESAAWTRSLATIERDALRLNAGGAFHESADGRAWCADHSFLGGRAFRNPSIADVANTDDDVLYVVERHADNQTQNTLAYRFALGDGLWRVRLHFAEIYFGAPGGAPGGAGSRVFSVWLEELKVLADYDIYATVGPAAADVYTFDVALADGELDLRLVSSVDRPKISAIEVERLREGSFETYCVGAPNSAGAGARISLLGATSVSENQFGLHVSGLPQLVTGLFQQGSQRVQTPLGAGVRCVGGSLFRLFPFTQSDAAGIARRSVDLQNPPRPAAAIVRGSTWNFQLWYRDGGTSNLSDALAVTFGP